jgi:hypothetical protein
MILLIPALPMLGVALLVWVLSPLWVHPVMVALAILLVVAGVVVSVRRIIRNEHAVRISSRPLDNYRWLQHWDATQFLRHFELFLRARGWRIISSSARGDDRILVVADKSKSKCRIALLGVRPAQAATEADMTALNAARKAQLATRAALIVESRPPPEEFHAALEQGIVTLRFTDLYTLEDALNVAE